MLVDDAFKRIKDGFCDFGVFAYKKQNYASRRGQVGLFKIDTRRAEIAQIDRVSLSDGNFIGVYDRSVTIEQFREDCAFVTGISIETD